MSNYKKKVAFMAIPLLCLNPILRAESSNGGLDIRKTVAIEESASTMQNTRKVTGVVKDENGEEVTGASVVEIGTTNGVTTDVNGRFELTIQANGSLRISYVGYIAQTVTPGSRSTLEVILQEDTQALEEVVIVAFGKMAKEAFTGSAGVMKSDELLKAQVTNPAQALAGRVAGVQIGNSSSQFGTSPQITIRGFGSISSDTEPLIVVDGMPFDGDLNLISPNDIESMTVLKDAASNALYGARGANGVIMVTTKRGKSGDAKVSVDAKWGVNSNGLKLHKTTNTREFYETYYKMLYNYYLTEMSPTDAHTAANKNLIDPSIGPGYMVYTVPSGQDFIQQGGIMNPNATSGALYTYNNQQFWLQADDWEKEGLQDGFRQEYNVSVSGASDRVNYYTSLSYLDQDGIQEGQTVNRLTARAKLDFQAKKWLKIGANFNYSKYDYGQTSEGTIGSGTIWNTIKNQAPVYPVYLRDASKNIMIDQWGEKMYDFAQSYDLSRAGGIGGNAIFGNKYNYNTNNGNSITAGGYADVQLMEGLTFTMNANAYSYDRRYTYSTSPFVDYYTSSSSNGYLEKSSSRDYNYNTQQLLNYVKQFDKHEISALLGHEYTNQKYEYLYASGYNFGIDGAYELAQVLNLNTDQTSYSREYNNEGYFFRAMYNYDTRYYGSVSFRRDASSRFSKDNRWGNFWSAGAAWLISKESFFPKTTWINSLKIKASVGSQGNDKIGDIDRGYHLYANSYNIKNNDNKVAFQWHQKGTENITWETNTNWNAGIEFDLFNGRLSGNADYFYRKTSDMLFALSTPPSIGYTNYYDNMGDMRNLGFELVLNGTLVKNKNWNWDVNLNISYIKNKVLRLPDEVKSMKVEGYEGYVDIDPHSASKYQYFVAEDLPLYSWYMYKSAGVDKETGEALYYKDIIDANGNVTGRETTKNSSQATNYLLGNALPDFYGGFGTTVTYRGFDFSINMTYQLGGKVLDYTYQSLMHTGTNATATTWHTDIFKAWTPENTNTNVPRLYYTEANTQTARSDRFLASASYLNCQNINFGYTLPSSLTRRYQIDNIRLYFSGENLFYIAARQGLDPRQTAKGYTNPELSSPIRTVSGGISLTF